MTARDRHPSKRYRGVYWYETRDGKRWGAIVERERDWQTGKRRPLRRHDFRTQEEAHEWRVEQQDRRRRGDTVEPSLIPLGQWCAQWLAAQADKRPATVRAYEMRIAHLTKAAGDVPLSRVTPQTIEAIFADLHRRGYQAATMQACHRCYKTLFQRAVEQRILYHNPAALVRPPTGERTRPRTWTADELKQFLAVNGSDPQWGVIWRFLAETWVRVGELTDLRWDAVDLETGTVRIERTITSGPDRQRASGSPKSAAGRRTIPISRTLVDLLQQHRDRQVFSGARQKRFGAESPLVFPGSRTGKWLRQPTIADALKVACKRAGVPVLTPHGIRHTGATIADQQGVNIKIISERLGHADIATTYRLYRHTDAAEHRQAADQIGDLLAI